MAGLEKPSQGRIVIGNNPVYNGSARSEIPAEERNLGLVFQSYALWPHKTVFENVAYPLKLRKTASAEIAQRVQAVLDQLGLGHLAKRHPHQLSGGQQQRVAIGRALVYNPPVILLDEPLSNLDAKLREEARVFLRELIIKLGLSALMVTHDQNEAMAISDRILLLNNGKIEQQGTPQEMYGSPTTLFTAEFMGSNNRLPGKVVALEGDRARIEGKDWALWGKAGAGVQVGQEGTAVIRVERVRLGEDPQGNQLELPFADQHVSRRSLGIPVPHRGRRFRGARLWPRGARSGAVPALPAGRSSVDIPESLIRTPADAGVPFTNPAPVGCLWRASSRSTGFAAPRVLRR
ncbi:Spermidine/putrescine import ATP-binding protein PotA [Serratia marcescens]|uniref:Spermidine/putrescine import ATP-binding protein PotA n=1 Tax=Serratia marcescens TaxID=615 RepID=A0A379YKX2_SERMA|nr:Spermidine/putrescine import ATP-binding protein PotA [Serratia marcescens]